MPIPLTFQHVREALPTIDLPELDLPREFLEALELEGEEVTAEINGLELQLPVLKRKLDALWAGCQEFEYELVSVFMHRGEFLDSVYSGNDDELIARWMPGKTSGAGHYWTYQAHLPDHSECHRPIKNTWSSLPDILSYHYH